MTHPHPSFDAHNDPIAITIPRFKILKKADGPFQRRQEPYIISLAIDHRSGGANPAIDFNAIPFPNVLVGDEISMLGNGHMLYGPKNPGEWVALSVLFMESDRDIRAIGAETEAIANSKATQLAIKAILLAAPTYGTVVGVLKELTELIAKQLKSNRDDELFRTQGVFLRDHPIPFDINRSYVRSNQFIEAQFQILPLQRSNHQGAQVQQMLL